MQVLPVRHIVACANGYQALPAEQRLVMRTMLFCQIALAAALSTTVLAQSTGAPGVITGGADGVTFNGKPAARQGDTTSDGSAIVEGSPNVFINGRPAAVLGGRTGCGGVVVGGAGGISINGKPAARTSDQTSGCPN
jgi:uncharacterized Zn-binding protein involved in type VI secretion